MKRTVIYGLLALIVIFSAYIYRQEVNIRPEVNDNSFQYALVDDAKNLWQQILAGKLSPFYLVDSFNNRWNEGLALSDYYNHLPQAVIGLASIVTHVGAHTFFLWTKYLMLILLPVMFFAGAKLLGMTDLAALLSAFFSQAIFTNGFYGIDSSNFLWRGWGLSSQLLALFFLPVALGYGWRYLGGSGGKGGLGKAVFFNFLVAECHSGIFLMLVISYPVIIFYEVIMSFRRKTESRDSGSLPAGRQGQIKSGMTRLIVFGGVLFILLSYFLVPYFLQGNYRNFSFWDPAWKFNSFGLKQIVTWFINGDLFDFNRLPVLTFLVLFGVLAGLKSFKSLKSSESTSGWLAILFIVYFLLYLGRPTWGRLIDLIPGLAEFHLSRFIVMVQVAGIFVAGEFTAFIIGILDASFLSPWEPSGQAGVPSRKKSASSASDNEIIKPWNIFIKYLRYLLIIGAIGVLSVYMERPVVKYATENNNMIVSFNKQYVADYPDYQKMVEKLRSMPAGRVYAGQPGNYFGRNLTVGGEPVYMAMAQDGFYTLGNAPESWSPNAESDQFFDENRPEFYDLYNVRYLVMPASYQPPKFARLVIQSGKYYLYRIATSGWFDIGVSDQTVTAGKTGLIDFVHLWLSSVMVAQKNYPAIIFGRQAIDRSSLWPRFPFAAGKTAPSGKVEDSPCPSPTDQSYCATVSLPKNCPDCIVVLKNTYHPNWQIFVNGKRSEAFPVFPFFIGIPLTKAGEYQVEAVYRPGTVKIILVWAAAILMLLYLVFSMETKIKSFTDLIAWQKAHRFVLKIYKITQRFPKEEKYGLSDQMRRAAVSITSNIAEGFYKRTSTDKSHFYLISLGSLAELQNQLLISKDLTYITKDVFDWAANESVTIHKLINRLVKSAATKY